MYIHTYIQFAISWVMFARYVKDEHAEMPTCNLAETMHK